MKISIKAAIALKTKALTGGLSLLFLLGGCHKKVNYFNGEIITVKDIPVSDTLTGERLLLDSIIAKGRGIDFNFADGMICDWKNEREYRLLGYISHMSENIADGYLQ